MWLFPHAAETPLLPPESDDKALERLQSELDTLHAAGVAREVKTINAPPTRRIVVGRTNDWLGQPIFREVPNRRADYRQYRSYVHKAFTSAPVPSLASVTVAYHRNCAVCDRTFNARLKIDHILRQARPKPGLPPPKRSLGSAPAGRRIRHKSPPASSKEHSMIVIVWAITLLLVPLALFAGPYRAFAFKLRTFAGIGLGIVTWLGVLIAFPICIDAFPPQGPWRCRPGRRPSCAPGSRCSSSGASPRPAMRPPPIAGSGNGPSRSSPPPWPSPRTRHAASVAWSSSSPATDAARPTGCSGGCAGGARPGRPTIRSGCWPRSASPLRGRRHGCSGRRRFAAASCSATGCCWPRPRRPRSAASGSSWCGGRSSLPNPASGPVRTAADLRRSRHELRRRPHGHICNNRRHRLQYHRRPLCHHPLVSGLGCEPHPGTSRNRRAMPSPASRTRWKTRRKTPWSTALQAQGASGPVARQQGEGFRRD